MNSMNASQAVRRMPQAEADLKPETDRDVVRNRAPKTRVCLMCGQPFPSEGAGERICRSCKTTAVWRTG